MMQFSINVVASLSQKFVSQLPSLGASNTPYAFENGRGAAGLLDVVLAFIALLGAAWLIQNLSGRSASSDSKTSEERWPD